MSLEALEKAFDLPAEQQPEWMDLSTLVDVENELSRRVGLVTLPEINELTAQMAKVACGEAFLLQTGDCAERFEDDPQQAIAGQLRAMIPATAVLLYGSGIPIVKVMRAAGQFAKPRSSAAEEKDGISLPSYRGDIVNGYDFNVEARAPDPNRMLKAYEISRDKMQILRSLVSDGFTDLDEMHKWNIAFAEASSESRYIELTKAISRAIKFVKASRSEYSSPNEFREAKIFFSHEGLLIPYERALTRFDDSDTPYASSTHLLWVGERTRQVDGTHVNFAGIIANPIEVKIGPTAEPEDVIELCKLVNPDNRPGKLTLVSRMGAGRVREKLPLLQTALQKAGISAGWICDPMHENTVGHNGQKTRKLDVIFDEVRGYFEACRRSGTWPGGIHLETSGEDVTECLGGAKPNCVTSLEGKYTTLCDPRLNPAQTIEMGFVVAEELAT